MEQRNLAPRLRPRNQISQGQGGIVGDLQRRSPRRDWHSAVERQIRLSSSVPLRSMVRHCTIDIVVSVMIILNRKTATEIFPITSQHGGGFEPYYISTRDYPLYGIYH